MVDVPPAEAVPELLIESYYVFSKTASCPARSSSRCSIDSVCPSADKDQQSQKCISCVPNCAHDSMTSSSPSHLATPRTAPPFSRVSTCSPLVRHLKMIRSSLPSAFVTSISSCNSGSECSIFTVTARGRPCGPANLLLDKFAFHVPVKFTLIYLCSSFAAFDLAHSRSSTAFR